MGMRGADIQQMQQLEQRFSQESAAVQDLVRRLDTTLAGTQWTGPAADRFRQEWDQQFKRALGALTEALNQNSVAVRNQWQGIAAATGGG